MTQTFNVGARSRFVTFVAWLFIVLSAVACSWAVIQNAAQSSWAAELAGRHGVPGLSEMWECVQIQGVPMASPVSVTVARPLRSKVLPSGCKPVERKITAPIAIRRSGEMTTSSVDKS